MSEDSAVKDEDKAVKRSKDVDKADKRKLRKASIEDLLVKDEQIVEKAEIHWGIYWHTVAVFIIAIIVSFMVFELGALLGVVAVLMFIHASIKKEILLLVLTNKRVLVRYGILQVDVVDMRFSKLESLELERMIPGYIMGYANVILMGTGNRYVVVPFVRNPVDFRRAYNRMTLKNEGEDLGEDE